MKPQVEALKHRIVLHASKLIPNPTQCAAALGITTQTLRVLKEAAKLDIDIRAKAAKRKGGAKMSTLS